MDSKTAAQYLIDPLNAPEPSAETGPGSSFARPVESGNSSPTSTNPYRRGSVKKDGVTTTTRQVSSGSTAHTRHVSNGSNGSSSKFPTYRENALAHLNDGPSPRRSLEGPPSYDQAAGPSRRRGSSLKERYPGDQSNKPLDIIRRDSRKAQRSPHLNKRQLQGPDLIDRLDPTINKMPYHHEGPYDAASFARNTDPYTSPVAALQETNREALKATAPENIKDSLDKHKPLDGVALVPPGEPDKLGRRLNYEEGANQMFEGLPEGGAYKRYEGVDYAEDDVRGQGEPSYSLDRALQNHTIHERDIDGHRGIELTDRPLMSDYNKGKDRKSLDTRDPIAIAGNDAKYSDLQYAADTDAHAKPARSGSIKEGLKRRIGSIRKKGLDEYLP